MSVVPSTRGHENWSSRLAFVLTALGVSVGLGNIWRFPYTAGENGGGAFILIYLVCVFGIGLPLLIAELTLGRRGRLSPPGSTGAVAVEAGHSPRWSAVGGMAIVAVFLVLGFYAVVTGWTFDYFILASTGAFSGITSAESGAMFDDLLASPLRLAFWQLLVISLVVLVVARGLRQGVERAAMVLMPLLFLCLVVLVVYALIAGDMAATYEFMIKPDFSKVTLGVVLAAVGQAFFSIGLAFAAMMTFGSYLDSSVSIPRSAAILVTGDTVVAVLAGFAVFPIVFAHGLEPSSGPGLVFETLPLAFGHMQFGTLIGAVFFLLLMVGALTSCIGSFEPMLCWAREKWNISRVRAAIASGIVVWILGVSTILSFNVLKAFYPLGFMDAFAGRTLFEIQEFVATNILLVVGGILMSVLTGWIMTRQALLDEFGLADGPLFKALRVVLRFIAPVALTFVLLMGIL
ncbi:MAG: sodium-dependent transporter [Xanthomonadales bacterium]|nr:sodium-dependent transporter [Xanthomonadales bacterium]